jgi:hypothetical protein
VTAANLTEVAQRGLRLLEASLRQHPPPGVTPAAIEVFFAEHRGELLAELSRLLVDPTSQGPAYTTPGTQLEWRTLREWLVAYRTLRRQPPSLVVHEAMVQHFLVLPDALILSADTEDLEAFRKVLGWIRPAPEEQEGHRFSHLRALLRQAHKRLRRTLTGGQAP